MIGNLTKWAVAAVLSIGAAAPSALAGSVTQPGDTMGVANGALTPEGLYFVNQANYGANSATPRFSLGAEVPLLVWQTPWKIFGGALLLTTGPTTVVDANVQGVQHVSGLFNPFVGAKLTWDLGGGWGVGYLLGAYIKMNTPVAYSSSSLNQRLAVSYTGDGWNLTANTILGINFDPVTNAPQGSPCPGLPQLGCNPNFFNLDLTATKRFGNWEVGAIGFYATDISTPGPGYFQQSKGAIGGLVGYSFGPAILQLYVTTEIAEQNYGARDTRAWSRLTLALGKPPPPPAFRPIGP